MLFFFYAFIFPGSIRMQKERGILFFPIQQKKSLNQPINTFDIAGTVE